MNKKFAEEFILEIKNILGDYIKQSGHVFYSNYQTLKKGKYFIMGVNPGGSEGELGPDASIEKSFESFLKEDYNEYYNDWYSVINKVHPLQRNLQVISEAVGFDLKSVCASNFIFKRSRKEHLMDKSGIDICYSVHKKIFDLVEPEIIFSFGKFTLNNLCIKFSSEGKQKIKEEKIPSGHGEWKIIIVDFIGANGKIRLINFPHLSIYKIWNRTDVLEKIKNACHER